MKIFSFLILMLIVNIPKLNAQELTAEPEQFVVVELFTSQGCSSCPRMDDALSNIMKDSYYQDKNIVASALHVKYWDYLGWTDLYGKGSFRDRQVSYAQALGLQNLATPQFILNGSEKPPLNETKIRTLIDNLLNNSASTGIKIRINSDTLADVLEIEYDIVGVGAGMNLVLVLVEDGLSNYIAAGENNRKVLDHERVVRVFKSISLNNLHGIVDINVPAIVDRKNATLQAFVQNTSTMKVLAGTRGIDLVDFITTEPIIGLDSKVLFYETVQVEESKELQLEINNEGNETLVITGIANESTTTDIFLISYAEFPMIIDPGEKNIVGVSFSPNKDILYKDKFKIISNGANISEKVIELVGTGFIPKAKITSDATTVFFDKTDIGATSVGIVQFSNPGTDNLVISDVQFENNEENVYSLKDLDLPLILAPDASYDMKIDFSPLDDITYKSNLVISSNAVGQETFSISLRGSGFNPNSVEKSNNGFSGLLISPNPSENRVFIKYNLSNSNHIKIQVCNYSGEVIALVKDEYQNPGEQSVNFDGSSIPQGTYFCQISVGERVFTGKFVIIR